MKHYQLFLALILICSACSKDRETPSGVKLTVIREGEGDVVKAGQFLVTRMVIKDSKDSIWRDTRKNNLPFIIPIQVLPPGKEDRAIEEAFRMLKNKDSVICKVTAENLFEGQLLPPNVKPEETLSFYIGVTEIADQMRIQEIQKELQAWQQKETLKLLSEQIAKDTVAIDAHIASKSIKGVIKDKSGIRLLILKMGQGPKPSLTNTVRVNYKAILMDNGQIVDQSDTPAEWPLNQLVQGWQIGFQMLPKGTKAILFVPSSLGYGPGGYPPDIPPNSNLVFEVELLDFF